MLSRVLLSLVLLVLSTAEDWNPSCGSCSCSYDEGRNVKRAHCDGEQLNLTAIPLLPTDTEFIYIDGGNVSLTASEFDRYPQLTHIYVNKNNFTVLPIGIFSSTKNVIEIDLEYNNLKILQSHLFSNLPHLKTVWLTSNQIAVLEDNCFYNVPQLIKITFGGNRLSKINVNFIDDDSSLEKLHFSNNPVRCDESLCEMMNRVVQQKMYEDAQWMPRCESPSKVEDMTWAEAVEAQWGTGLEHCPRTRRDAGLKTELQELKNVLVVYIEGMNNSMNEIKSDLKYMKDELHNVKYEHSQLQIKLYDVKDKVIEVKDKAIEVKDRVNSLYAVKDGQQELKDKIDVMMRQNEYIINQTKPQQLPNIFWKEVLHMRGNSSNRGFLQLLYTILPAHASHNSSTEL